MKLQTKIQNIKHWGKKLCNIVENYDRDKGFFNHELKEAVQLLRERTDIHADIGFHARSQNQVIVIGRYNKRDFIQTYSLLQEDLNGMVAQLREMEKYGAVRRIDAPIGVRTCVENVFDGLIDNDR